MNIVKGIAASILGIVIGVFLTLGTDYVFESAGILPHDNLWVPAALIWYVLAYRAVYNIIGSYIVARFAPHHKFRYIMAVGALGTIVSIIGALITKDMNLGPTWYAWTLALLSLPSAWIGWKVYKDRV